MRVSPTAIVITAGFMSVLLFAVQVVNAAACLITSQPSVATQPMTSIPGDPGIDDDCDERPLFTVTKADRAKHPESVLDSGGSQPTALLHTPLPTATTRGNPTRREKAPLFLRTGRLRN